MTTEIPDEVARQCAWGAGGCERNLDRGRWRKDPFIVQKLKTGLDLGESEVIALALELNADVLIIDEVAGESAKPQVG